ncbi:hypothetical protein B0O99DRAFT_730959 [Bisporella sp. PMI_857]|nr:hypothetical protein B0O99DRAFT_730959 [Bisporella sp. PMI_857]
MGLVIMDLPPEETVSFRKCVCRLSYSPLIAPSTSDNRRKLLCGLADSFYICCVANGYYGVLLGP